MTVLPRNEYDGILGRNGIGQIRTAYVPITTWSRLHTTKDTLDTINPATMAMIVEVLEKWVERPVHMTPPVYAF